MSATSTAAPIPIIPIEQRALDSVEQRNLDAFNARMRPHAAEYSRRFNEIVNSRRNVRHRLRQLRALVTDVTSHVKANTACRRGCSHCCHIPVIIHEEEAAMIGEEIGRKAQRPARWWRKDRDLKAFDSSYANPCTFLVNNECSIYEHRPLACRQQWNMAATADLCKMDAIRDGVPYLNLRMFDDAAVRICGTPNVGELREFFPPDARVKS